MKDYVRLARLVAPRTGLFLCAVGCMALLALTTSGYAYLVGPLLRFVYSGGREGVAPVLALLPASWLGSLGTHVPLASTSRATAAPGLASPADLALLLAGAVFLVSAVKGMAAYGERVLMARIGQHVVRDLRITLFAHLLTVTPQALLGERRGDLAARISADVIQIQQAVTYGIAGLARDALQAIALGLLVVRLDPWMSLLALLALPIVGLSLLRLSRRVRREYKETWDHHGRLYSVAAETVGMVPLVRAYGAEGRARRVWRELTDLVHDWTLRASRSAAIASPLTELLGAAAIAGTLGYASVRIRAGELAPETFVSFFAAIFLLYAPVKGLGGTGTMFAQALAALDRMDKLMALPVEPPDRAETVRVGPLREHLELRDVHYAYPRNEDDAGHEPAEVLAGIDLTIRAGEALAVVGASGAGKSTLLLVLMRLLEPTHGEILWDGVSYEKASRTSVRAQLAWVTQEPLVLADTVEANIALADAAPDRERTVAAARAAAAHVFIEALPKGYDTMMAEAGARLSVGQRQRLCIARALYRRASIIVFDEPTSALDGTAERELAETIERLVKEPPPDVSEHRSAAIIVSHRRSTVLRADRAVVLDRGRIVQEGAPEALLGQPGPFRELFR